MLPSYRHNKFDQPGRSKIRFQFQLALNSDSTDSNYVFASGRFQVDTDCRYSHASQNLLSLSYKNTHIFRFAVIINHKICVNASGKPQHIVVSKERIQFNLLRLHLGQLCESTSDGSNDRYMNTVERRCIMAKNTGKDYRKGEVRDRSQALNPKTEQWVKRDNKTGKFMDVKENGKPFKGVRKEH